MTRHGPARPGPARHAHCLLETPASRISPLHTHTQLRIATHRNAIASQRNRNASHRNRTESDFPFGGRLTIDVTPQPPIHIYIYVYINRSEAWGVTSIVRRPQPGNRIRFGCGAMRCDCDALRCDCDAMRCEAVCACEEERFCWLVFPSDRYQRRCGDS